MSVGTVDALDAWGALDAGTLSRLGGFGRWALGGWALGRGLIEQ